MRIYLDVCCLNRPFDDQAQDRIHLEAEAILSIIRHIRSTGCKIISSDIIDFEIAKNPDRDKRLMTQILSTIHDVHVKVDASLEKRALDLGEAGLRALDALHVACAEKAKADILLTTDDDILNKYRKSRTFFNIRIENPLLWVTEVLK